MPSGTSSSCEISFSRDAIFGRCDLAGNAAAACGVRHQHRITAGEREIRRQCGALGAALFLDDLHQHHLPALDHFLNLVLAPESRKPLLHFFEGVGAADGFNRLVVGVLLAVAVFRRVDSRGVGMQRCLFRRRVGGEGAFGSGGRLLAFGDRSRAARRPAERSHRPRDFRQPHAPAPRPQIRAGPVSGSAA